MQFLLDYSKCENFVNVIDKAKYACNNDGEEEIYHFPDLRITMQMPRGTQKEIDDILLIKYACYLVVQN